MVPALQENLIPAGVDHRLHLRQDLRLGEHVRISGAIVPVEGAKQAVGVAEVRGW